MTAEQGTIVVEAAVPAPLVPRAVERGVERWFVGQGVPNFIRDYRAASKVWTRALPALLVWYALSIIDGLLFVPDGANGMEIAAILAIAIAVLVAGWVVLNLIRHQRPFARPDRVGRLEVAVFLFAPALIPIVLAGDVLLALWMIVSSTIFIAITYVVTQTGLVGIVRWGLSRVVAGLGDMSRLFGRALAILVVLIGFAYFDSSLWQIAQHADPLTMVGILALFAAISVVFSSSILPAELARITTRLPTRKTLAQAVGTPAAPIALDPRVAASIRVRSEPHPFERREIVNLVIVILTNEAIGGLFILAFVTVALVVLGVLAVPQSVASGWAGHPVDPVFDALPALSWESIKVALILGGFCALAFSVSAQSDGTYGADFERATVWAARRAAAVREVYLTGLDIDEGLDTTLPDDGDADAPDDDDDPGGMGDADYADDDADDEAGGEPGRAGGI